MRSFEYIDVSPFARGLEELVVFLRIQKVQNGVNNERYRGCG